MNQYTLRLCVIYYVLYAVSSQVSDEYNANWIAIRISIYRERCTYLWLDWEHPPV